VVNGSLTLLPRGSRPIAVVYDVCGGIEWLIPPARVAGQFLDNNSFMLRLTLWVSMYFDLHITHLRV